VLTSVIDVSDFHLLKNGEAYETKN